jgi:hypothetical protein
MGIHSREALLDGPQFGGMNIDWLDTHPGLVSEIDLAAADDIYSA